MHRTRIRRAAHITRSGLKKYPKELIASLRSLQDAAPPRVVSSAPLDGLDRDGLAAIWLGHASVLMRLGDLTILTDPVFSDRIGLKVGPVTFGIPRLAPVPVYAQHLPRIDLILLSHAHFDHLDRPTLSRLASPHTTVVTARSTAGLIPPGFGRVVELDWSKDIQLDGVNISAVRPVHWGARKAYDRHRGFNSYLLETDDHRVLFAGDTAMTDAFDRIGGVDLAVFGIGAYEPWIHRHANPEQAWAMAAGAGAEHFLPMHHSTFKLGEEAIDEPLRRLVAAAGDQQTRIVSRTMGQVWTYDAPPTTAVYSFPIKPAAPSHPAKSARA